MSALHTVRRAAALALLCGVAAHNERAAAAETANQPVALPLFFEPNVGQVEGPARFLARGQDYEFLLSPDNVEVVLWKVDAAERGTGGRSYEARAARLRFLGANPEAPMQALDQLPGKVNYLLGTTPERWRTGLATSARVEVCELYPGVDLVYYGNPQQLEYDFQVAPGAEPAAIRIAFDGATQLAVSPAGELVMRLGDAELRQPKPRLYQVVNGAQQEITGGYRLQDNHTLAFAIGAYDHALPLVIDPSFSYSTFFGGNRGDAAYAVKVDAAGSAYIAGATLSTVFRSAIPASAFQSTFKGGNLLGDAFVAKFDNTGANLLYYTYLGGSADDAAYDLALDAAGNVYVTGVTSSSDFPTRNALFPTIASAHDPILNVYLNDAFVAELNTNGSALVFSTFLGGSEDDVGFGITVDPSNYIYVTGYTTSTNFPYGGGYQSWYAGRDDVFVTKLAPRGTRLVYSTFLGGSGQDRGEGIAADENGYAYVTGFTYSTNFPYWRGYQNWHGGGSDAFVTRLNPNGSLSWSTFLGGGYNDFATKIVVDAQHQSWITGSTISPTFPHSNSIPGLTAGNNGTNTFNYDVFLSRFDSAGHLTYSSVFGGRNDDSPWGLALDPTGHVFIAGTTFSLSFPVTNVFGLFSSTNAGGHDAFVVALDTGATNVLYSGYLGGSHEEFAYGVAADAEGNAYVTGLTYSTNFPTASPYQATLRGPDNAFLAKIRLTDPVVALVPGPGGLVAQWPATAPGYALQSAISLSQPVMWSTNPQPAVLQGGVYTTTAPVTNGAGLFRLVRP